MPEQHMTFTEFLKKKKDMTLAEFWELPEFEQEAIESIYNEYYKTPREEQIEPITKWKECDGYGKPAHTCQRCHSVYSDTALFIVSGQFDFPEYCPHCGEHMYFVNEVRYEDEP